jgi:HSP20 family protein
MMTLTPKSRIGTRTNPRMMDRLADDLWRTAWARPGQSWNEAATPAFRPAMDVIEHEDGVSIRLDLPGMTPDDVNVEVEGDLLTISGEMGHTAEQEGERYHRRERYSGGFKRSLRLADTLDAANINATFTNGVLTLELPKRPESQPKRIKVETV